MGTCWLLVGGMKILVNFSVKLTIYAAQPRQGGLKRGDGGALLGGWMDGQGISYPDAAQHGMRLGLGCQPLCVRGQWDVALGPWSEHTRARKTKGIVVWAMAALLMNRACASLVSALRVSIVPSLRSAIAAPRFAQSGTRFARFATRFARGPRGYPLGDPLCGLVAH